MSSSGKKATNKDDLRRLMESQKRSLNGQNKKIESPLARYNSLGQLSCLVCNCPIKNEVLWNAHILKKTHKDNVLLYKAQLLQKPADHKVSPHPPSQSPALKRKSLEVDALQGKQKLLKLSETFSGTSAALETSSVRHQPTSAIKNVISLPSVDRMSQQSDDNDSDMDVDSVSSRPMSLPPPAHGSYVSSSGASSSNIVSSSLEDKIQPLPEGLPEGFMDDPVMDAKVRNVPYRDKMEEQLELFQKEMKQQHMVSEALLEEDDEQREEERQIYEVEEQMHNWSKILDTVEKKNELLKTSGIKHDEMQDDDDEDSDDDDDDLDWRAKRVFKK